MSHISDTIFAFSIMEEKAAVGRFLDETLDLPDMVASGTRRFVPAASIGYALQRPTYWAALNYLDIEKFVACLRRYPWRVPEEVQLLIADEHDEPHIYTERFQTKAEK